MTVQPPAVPPRSNDLEFTHGRMTRWLSPKVLGHAIVRVLLSGVFGNYMDKREVMASLREPDIEDLSGETDVWLDYVSDLGDGFDGTYAIAHVVGRPNCTLLPPSDKPETKPAVTERGRVLVMGGDECYPTASAARYENQTIAPYRASLGWVDGQRPSLYAVPGNHDWYDGLTSFMRAFCQGASFGAWQTKQTRSYFAVKLPHGWWLWGIDVQFNTYIDAPQREYFSKVAEKHLQEGDQVILCSATPAWVKANSGEPEAYAVLDWFERTIIRPKKACVQVGLSGDSHYYAHYVEDNGGRHKFTSGGAGAFLSATHHIPEKLVVPPDESTARNKTTPAANYSLAAAYPDKDDSRKLARGIVQLPWRNWDFILLMAAAQAVLAWGLWTSLAPVARFRDVGFVTMASGLGRSLPAVAITLVFLMAAVGFTKKSRTLRGWGVGLVNGAAHIALGVGLTTLAASWFSGVNGAWLLPVVLVFCAMLGGFIASELVAGYLYIVDRLFGMNTDELFAGMSKGDRKNFLRLHFERDGALTVYPVKLHRLPRKWTVDEKAGPSDPLFTPVGGLNPTLIEEPVRIAGPVKKPVPSMRIPEAEVNV